MNFIMTFCINIRIQYKENLYFGEKPTFSVLPLPVGTGRPRPPLSKKSIDFDHEIMENEKSSDFDQIFHSKSQQRK
jgi:hypothetical protein